ncbi:MAG: ribosomal RNA small subunit methyltransferase A [Planctomycetia bacterium]|nr:ribosomal RNA small subunit methyltransferase A [Planctomycetia bacterium]
MPTQRQTLSFLRTLFEERGIQPKNKLGQNFLIDLNLIDLVIRTAELTTDDLALEIGSGTGSLTARLIELAGAVVSVELDTAFAQMTQDLLGTHFAISEGLDRTKGASRDRTRLIHADILASKNRINPDVLAALDELLNFTKQIKLVANLPYAVSVPVISNLILTEFPVERMVVMVQWELAERMLATPGTKAYASLAVLIQSLAHVELVRKVPPSVFYPRPAVDSAIVMIRPDPAKRANVGDPIALRNFLRDLYVHRRKNLRGALSSLPSGRLAKGDVDSRLEALKIDGTLRAEALDLEQHLVLCREFGDLTASDDVSLDEKDDSDA